MTAYYRVPYRVPRRYRRRSRSSVLPLAAASVALVAAAAVVTGHQGHHHPGPGPVIVSASWDRSLLASAGLPQTSCNIAALAAWRRAEGSNPAWHNLLDTTQREPGSWSVNSVGVQAFLNDADGLRATVTTLNNGYYPGILAALHRGDSAQAVADAVASSPWGTEPFRASCR